MIEGITLLNQFETTVDGGAYIALIIGGILTLAWLTLAIFCFCDYEVGAGISVSILAVIASILPMTGVAEITKPPETHYQVLIDESVSMTEFFEKYEIIEVEGSIYTIKEK